MPLKRDDVVVKFGADASGLQRVIKGVKASAKDLSGYLGSVGQSIGAFFTRTLAGAITGIGVALGAATRNAVAFGDALAKTADKVGVSVENLQRLRYAASASGVEQRTLDMALQRFSRRLGEAAQGTGVLYKELQRLGIDVYDAQGRMRSSTDVLNEYADAVKNAGSEQEQLRLSFVAFDSEGAALVNMLRDGAIGLQELTRRADELGLVVDESAVRAAERMNQRWEDFTTRVSVRAKAAILDLVETIELFTGAQNDLVSIEARRERIEKAILELERQQEDAGWIANRILDYRISRLKLANEALEEEATALKKANDAKKTEIDQTRQLAALKNEEAKAKEKVAKQDEKASKPNAKQAAPVTAKRVGPDNTYAEQDLKDYRAYKSGEIDRAEYLKRERTRNPYSNPESPYAGDFSAPSYGSVQPQFTVKPVVSQEFAAEVQRAVDAAMQGRTYTIKVKPELVGMEGVEIATRDTADKEGSHE